jgi:Ca-activated chloride channel homolog
LPELTISRARIFSPDRSGGPSAGNRCVPGQWVRPGPAAGTLRAHLGVLGLAVLVVVLAGSQHPASGQQQVPAFNATSEVSSVLVPVTVRDKRGRIVATLEKGSFRLQVDGIETPIRSFWREGGLPLSFTFLVDTSGSMGKRRLGKAREAIKELTNNLRAQDEVCLITFGAAEVKRRLPFGSSRSMLDPTLEALKGFGTTALYDMLTISPNAMEGASNIRRAIILFTDGVDTASEMTPDDAVRVLSSLQDPLYVLGIEPPPADEGPVDSYEKLLARFAEASGGRYLRADTAAKLPEFARSLRQELTMRYILDFQPSGVGTTKWRTIAIKVKGDYQVSAREGYRGTLP